MRCHVCGEEIIHDSINFKMIYLDCDGELVYFYFHKRRRIEHDCYDLYLRASEPTIAVQAERIRLKWK